MPVDEDGKTDVMIHFGLTKHDLFTPNALKYQWTYNGSAGCMVTPSYFQFRNKLIKLFLHDNQGLLTPVQGLDTISDAVTMPASIAIYDRSHNQAVDELAFDWGTDKSLIPNFIGTVWVIRPDEPSKK